jgi:hypothetical protein
MSKITLISTFHHELGNCNANNLAEIIESIRPDVIFLEALQETYTAYDILKFNQFGVFSKKLEIKAIQIYSLNRTFNYIPVLDFGLSSDFETMLTGFFENDKYRELEKILRANVEVRGFEFLNSKDCIDLHEEMKELGKAIINDVVFYTKVNNSINDYENNMLGNILQFSMKNSYKKGIFMCGSGHRRSLVDKIGSKENILEWEFYNQND